MIGNGNLWIFPKKEGALANDPRQLYNEIAMKERER